MLGDRRLRLVGAALAATAVLFGTACGSSDPGSTSPAATDSDPKEVLGTPNPATGTPIKIGYVGDGKSAGIDHTPVEGAFKATVDYANEYLGGINGHKIEVVSCATNNTPTDATNCGIEMANEKVAAVIVPVSAQDSQIFKTLADTGIPYLAYAAGSQEVITGKNAFLLVNPIATLAGPAKLAKEAGYKKAAVVQIDVPAATGTAAIATTIYQKAGVELDIIKVSPQTADMTPQIQQAISSGAEQFTIVGTDEFNTTGIKALKQLGFTGKIVLITAPSKEIADNVPDGLKDVVYITSATSDPNDADVKVYNAVLATYMKDIEPSAQSAWSFGAVMGLVKALTGQDAAVDATTVSAALASMPAELPLPLGGGLTYQCGAKVLALLPNVCTGNVLWTTLDAEGKGEKYEVLDVQSYMPGA